MMATSPGFSGFFLVSLSFVTFGGLDGLSGRGNIGDGLRDWTGGAVGRVDVEGTSSGRSGPGSFFGGFITFGGRVTRAENLATSTEETDEAGDVGDENSLGVLGVCTVSLSAIGLKILSENSM